MISSHKIKNAVFGIRFGSKAALLQEHASLSGLIMQDLMPVVNAVLSEHALADSVICIDKLEIDLGRIHTGDLRAAFKGRLRKVLDTTLKERIDNLKRSPSLKERIIPGPQRHLELIQHFLKTGTLPWTAKFESGGGIDCCLQSVVAHRAADFVKFLKINSHRPQIIQRLVRQFPTDTIRQIARLLAPVQAETALKAMDPLQRRSRSRTVSHRQTSPAKAVVSIRETRRIFKGYDLYESLRFYLRHGMTPWSAGIVAPDISMAKIMGELRASYPEKLIKIAKELQFDPGLCRSAAEKLTPSLMNRFIAALVTVSLREKDHDRSTFIQSIIDSADRATDRESYYAEILGNLVTRRPFELKQIIARNRKPQKTASKGVFPPPGHDPDLIRANLTALLKTGKKTNDPGITFSRLLDDLEKNFPSELRDYIAWLAANKNRFTSFVKRSGIQDVNQRLAYLAGFPSLKKRAIAVLEALSAKADQGTFQKKRIFELSASGRSDSGLVPDRQIIEDESALIGYLTGDRSLRLISDSSARVIFKQRIRHGSDTLYAALGSRLKDPGARKKMITLLTENWLTRVLAGLRPDLHLPVQLYADTIMEACNSKALIDRPEKVKILKWDYIFTYLAKAENQPFQQSDFIRHFITFLTDRVRKMNRVAFTAVLSQNLTAGLKSANRPAHLAVLQELGRMGIAYADLKPERPTRRRDTAENILEEVVVQNAGIVVAAPYLPKLWAMLNLTTEGGKFRSFYEAERAVHLLQFMADKNTESPEYQLVLNKMLCGIKLSAPITRRIETTAREREAIEGLLRGMIENWKTIGHTSVEGFRDSFLRRRGWLTLRDDAWHLKVEQRAFDMLLDSIPWGFATIKYPWMERVLYVKWR